MCAMSDNPIRSHHSTPTRTPNRRLRTPRRSNQRPMTPSQHHVDQPRGRSSPYELPRSMLPSVFGESGIDLSTLMRITSDLRRVQSLAGERHRFHLFVETDKGEVSSRASGRFERVVTRVMFSPTISTEHMEQGEPFHSIVRMLNGLSWEANSNEAFQSTRHLMTPARDRTPSNSVGNDVGQRSNSDDRLIIPTNRTYDAEEEDLPSHTRSPSYPNVPLHENFVISTGRRPLPNSAVANWFACHRNDLQFPSWFPFRDKEYTSGPQVTGEPLYVKKAAVANFEVLEIQQIHWIYRELFEFLFREAKRKKRRGLAAVFKYACFTPPWLRSQIIKGEKGDYADQSSVYFTTVVVPDMRNQRSRMGAARLAYILGAFLQYEPEMTRKAFVHLLRVVPLKPSLQKTRARPRVSYMRPLSNDRVPRRADERFDENDNADNAARDGTTDRANVINIEEEGGSYLDPALSEDILPVRSVRGRSNSTNIQGRSGSRANRSTSIRGPLNKRLRDQHMDLQEDDNRQNSERRRVKRRIHFEPVERQTINQGTDVDIRSTKVKRRVIPKMYFSPSSNEDEEELEHRDTGELSDDDQDKEPHEEEDELEPNERNADRERSTNTNVQQCEQLVPVRINCGYGDQCRFRYSSVMQDERYMLSKCRRCFRRIHDLCKGGESGENLCLACK